MGEASPFSARLHTDCFFLLSQSLLVLVMYIVSNSVYVHAYVFVVRVLVRVNFFARSGREPPRRQLAGQLLRMLPLFTSVPSMAAGRSPAERSFGVDSAA